ncbi:NUDIX hydrolase [Actinomycetospora rhizophila]|uniref:NUDIX hydrolase n=1 Tax=Actinomycetospora rhizophila TaxID=1416876 RepID=A0ABV9ZPJ1_9PSEU
MTESPLHSVSVAGVAFDEDGRVLLIRRQDNGQWQAPGGVLELAETPQQGVVREVFEETGVLVEVERLTGVYKNLVKGVVALVFRCHPISGQPTSSDEAAEVAWVPLNAGTDRMNPAFAVRVFDASREAGPPVPCRIHDGVHLL